jgi:hypothetical protein
VHVSIEPSLLERAVFQAVRAEPATQDEYQRAFSTCYREPPGDRREQAFADLHERWFDRLGLRRRVLDRVKVFRHVDVEIRRLVVADAKSRSRASVELFGKPGGHALVIAVTPSLLLDAPAFDYWVRFELQHIDDMLDPDFAYDKDALPAGSSAVVDARTRDRFALLWAIAIDARLAALPTAPSGLRDRRRGELIRAFGWPDSSAADSAMDRLWPRGGRSMRPNHAALIAWASDGMPGFAETTSPQPTTATPAGGAACPLCRFPTFDWADSAALNEQTLPLIYADFPAWNSGEGLCGRCAELYRGRHQHNSALSVAG